MPKDLDSSPLTRREYFAAMCLQGIFSNSSLVAVGNKDSDYAEMAIAVADALIEGLTKDV